MMRHTKAAIPAAGTGAHQGEDNTMGRPQNPKPFHWVEGIHGRAWIHEPGDLARGEMLYLRGGAGRLSEQFKLLAAAQENSVFMPYLGTWDGDGRLAYAYDLLAYTGNPTTYARGAEVVENQTVYGVALYRMPDRGMRSCGDVPRYTYDVHQVTYGRMVVRLLNQEFGSWNRYRLWERESFFWENTHDWDGGNIAWEDVKIVGNLFEDEAEWQGWGLNLDLADVLQLLLPKGGGVQRP